MQNSASSTKTARGKSLHFCVDARKPTAAASESSTAARSNRVAGSGVAPDAAVEPEHDERDVARGEDHGQGDVEDVRSHGVRVSLTRTM